MEPTEEKKINWVIKNRPGFNRSHRRQKQGKIGTSLVRPGGVWGIRGGVNR